jgi:hypothetical protein
MTEKDITESPEDEEDEEDCIEEEEDVLIDVSDEIYVDPDYDYDSDYDTYDPESSGMGPSVRFYDYLINSI